MTYKYLFRNVVIDFRKGRFVWEFHVLSFTLQTKKTRTKAKINSIVSSLASLLSFIPCGYCTLHFYSMPNTWATTSSWSSRTKNDQACMYGTYTIVLIQTLLNKLSTILDVISWTDLGKGLRTLQQRLIGKLSPKRSYYILRAATSPLLYRILNKSSQDKLQPLFIQFTLSYLFLEILNVWWWVLIKTRCGSDSPSTYINDFCHSLKVHPNSIRNYREIILFLLRLRPKCNFAVCTFKAGSLW